MSRKYDFSGWASRYDTPCSDGRTIRKNAFKDMDGETVSLVWGHDHETPMTILGNALIEHRDEGPYIYGSFNNTPEGQHAKEAVQHGDVKYLSIYASRLKESAGNVMHGVIREVSLVYGGANPKAYIDHAVLAHGDGTYSTVDDEAVIFYPSEIIAHSDSDDKQKEEGDDDEFDLDEALESLNEKQRVAVGYLLRAAKGDTDDSDDDEDEEDEDGEDETDETNDDGDDADDNSGEVEHSEEEHTMKYNAFENDDNRGTYISHADQRDILAAAKDRRVGSFKNALNEYLDEHSIQHDDESYSGTISGFDTQDVIDSQGYTSFTAVLPEYRDVRPGAPELVTNDQTWVNVVMSKTHKSPISRIRTGQVDIRNAEQLRAKGYQKGNKKPASGNIKLARRVTDPQTVMVRSDIHRDDIVDITDFDYVKYLYDIDRMMLNEEVATAIMLGDGRQDSDPYKIFPEHIRPIWTDDELYTIRCDLDSYKEDIQGTETEGYFGAGFVDAEAMVAACLHSREDYKGTGTPDMFITPRKLNNMLLARDRNGRRIYSTKAELASAFNVNNIYTAEQFAGKVYSKTVGNVVKRYELDAIMVNLADYHVGSTKGGQVTHFTQFDLDFNIEKSMLETRLSGALTRIYSAIVIEHEVVTGTGTEG